MKALSKLTALLCVSGMCISCGGGSSAATAPILSPPPASISISPMSASVRTGAMQEFFLTVSDGSVTWQVNTVIGGNSTVGTISSDGLYTAPTSAPNPSTVTVLTFQLPSRAHRNPMIVKAAMKTKNAGTRKLNVPIGHCHNEIRLS